MSTLGEDILALQNRLLAETGLPFNLNLVAYGEGAEQAMRAGEILTQVLGGQARIQEHTNTAWLTIDSPSVTATVFFSKAGGERNAYQSKQA